MSHADKPAISLRRSLRYRVGILVSAAVVVVGAGFFLFGVKPIVDRVAENDFTRAATELDASLDQLFEPAEQILRMSRGWIGESPPALDDPGELNRIFLPVLETLPQASSIVAGTSAGEGWMLLVNADGSLINRMTDLGRWYNEHRFFERDTSGEVRSYRQTFEYDPREPPGTWLPSPSPMACNGPSLTSSSPPATPASRPRHISRWATAATWLSGSTSSCATSLR